MCPWVNWYENFEKIGEFLTIHISKLPTNPAGLDLLAATSLMVSIERNIVRTAENEANSEMQFFVFFIFLDDCQALKLESVQNCSHGTIGRFSIRTASIMSLPVQKGSCDIGGWDRLSSIRAHSRQESEMENTDSPPEWRRAASLKLWNSSQIGLHVTTHIRKQEKRVL